MHNFEIKLIESFLTHYPSMTKTLIEKYVFKGKKVVDHTYSLLGYISPFKKRNLETLGH